MLFPDIAVVLAPMVEKVMDGQVCTGRRNKMPCNREIQMVTVVGEQVLGKLITLSACGPGKVEEATSRQCTRLQETQANLCHLEELLQLLDGDEG